MSAIKRAIDDLAVTISEAIYTECFDMPDYMEWTKADVEEGILNSLTDGEATYILKYMQEMVDEMSDESQPDKFELTISAIAKLEAFIKR